MAYLGNVPARSFISFERQVFTIVNSQTAYTLSHSVTNENDIRLVVNNVVQEPGSGKAYTATGTTLTLSAALTNGTDEMYCVFLGRAVGTVNAPAGSVGTSQLADDAVTADKLASGVGGVSGISSSADATAMTITSDEKIGIGETTPLGLVHVKTADTSSSVSTNADELIVEGTRSGMTFLAANDNYSYINFGDSGASDIGSIRYGHPNNDLKFVTNSADQWTLDSSGNWLPAATDHGIYLGVNSATASNLLNDYEFGTWTPALTGSPSGSYTYQYGNYTKINKMVYITGFLQGNFSGGSGSAKISGLPFTPDSGSNVYYEPVTIGFTYGLGVTIYQAFFQADATEFFLLKEPSGGSRTHADMSNLVSSDMRISFSGFYNTAA
jgi:hypothetical protein